MKNIFIISDVHLGDVNFKYNKFIIFLSTIPKGSTVIINGDFEDLCKSNIKYIRQKYFLIYEKLKDFHVIRLRGNHDNLKSLYKKYTFNYYGCKVIVIHGDEFDFLNSKVPYYTLVVSKIEQFINSLFHCNIKRILNYLTFGSLYYINNKIMKKAYLKYSSDYDIIVIGHTHFPCVKNINNKVVINCGDWVSHCTYVKFNSNKNVSLIDI